MVDLTGGVQQCTCHGLQHTPQGVVGFHKVVALGHVWATRKCHGLSQKFGVVADPEPVLQTTRPQADPLGMLQEVIQFTSGSFGSNVKRR